MLLAGVTCFPLMLNRSRSAVHASLINLKNRGWERKVSGLARGRVGQRGPGGGSQEVPRGSRGQDPGGETQGRSGRGGGQLLREPWANNGLIKERVWVGRSWAELQPVNLLSSTQANGPIVLLWERAEAWAWELQRSCPERHHGGHSLFAWPQNDSSVIHAEGSGHSRGYLVIAPNGQFRVWVPTRGPLKKGSDLPPDHFSETKALDRLV